jgi:hypothetical protein
VAQIIIVATNGTMISKERILKGVEGSNSVWVGCFEDIKKPEDVQNMKYPINTADNSRFHETLKVS